MSYKLLLLVVLTIQPGILMAQVYDNENIKNEISKKSEETQECFQSAHDRKPGVSGKVSFGFGISDAGNAVGIKVLSTDIKDAIMLDCLRGIISKVKFLPAPKSVTVNTTYNFNFTSAQAIKSKGKSGKK